MLRMKCSTFHVVLQLRELRIVACDTSRNVYNAPPLYWTRKTRIVPLGW